MWNWVPSGIVVFCVFLVTVFGDPTQVTFHLREGLRSGTFVGSLGGERTSTWNITVEELECLQYYFLETTKLQSLFSINDRTGDLYTSVVIDRETVCEYSTTCLLQFNIAVRCTTTSFFTILNVVIVVEDVNDNHPLFPKDVISLKILESEQVGQTFRIDAAVDKDTGAGNSELTYSIKSPSGTFRLNAEKVDGNVELKIVLNDTLDREKMDSYQVYVVATDGGTTRLSSTLTVNVSILDVNDCAPEFDQSIYNVNITEDTEAGSIILGLSATDNDVGTNGEILYRFSPRQSGEITVSEIESVFSIHETTGDLRIVGQLVYQPGLVYNILIDASDKGEPPYVSQVEVLVNVADSGNNSPNIRLNLPPPGNIVNVSESVKIDTFVAHVSVEDTDLGPNGEVQCEVYNSFFGLPAYGVNGYKVVVSAKLDRETKDLHTVNVTCFDGGSPPMSSSASFFVRVTDFNDNAPKFLQEIYNKDLLENNVLGDEVLRVTAKDKDNGINGEFTYRLHGDSLSRFMISEKTGIIYANYSFDREVASQVMFHVLAVDKGTKPLTGTTTVLLNILDVNDNAPKLKKRFQFYIMENLQIGTPAGNMSATDSDEGPNGLVDFEVASELGSEIPVLVNLDGTMYTNQELDRETRSRYDFTVSARDRGSPPMSSSVEVVVFVLDANDNGPTITFPNTKNFTISALFTSPPEAVIASIEASDPDDGRNKELTFSIEQGNDDGIFSINSKTGDIHLTKKLEIEADESFPLVVAVHDNGEPQHGVRTLLNIILTYTNATGIVLVGDEGTNKYVVISVVVVIVTLLLSAGIIAIILVLRWVDQRRHKTSSNSSEAQVISPVRDQDKVYQISTSPDGPDGQKKKKEVSFSLDDDFDNIGNELSVSRGSLSTDLNRSLENPPSYTSVTNKLSMYDAVQEEKRQNQIKALKLQQILLQQRSEANNFSRAHHEDSHSETSGETITSDSGRGGSEEDIPNNPHTADETRSLDTTSQQMPFTSLSARSLVVNCRPQSVNIETSRQIPNLLPRTSRDSLRGRSCENSAFTNSPHRHSVQLPPQRPPRQPYSQGPLNTSESKRPYSEGRLSRDVSDFNSRLPFSNGQNMKTDLLGNWSQPMCATSDSDFGLRGHGPMYYSRQESLSTVRSRDDDESTTTSGSYTINPDELEEEFFTLQRDLIV